MTYCLSDVHAEYGLFMRLLDRIKFSSTDSLIVCGDMVEKGNDTVKLLKTLAGMPNARCIIGNHEYDFLKYYWGLMRQSPDDFDLILSKLRGYFQGDGNLLDWQIVDWLESLPYYIEEKDYVCVHAGVPLDGDGRILPLERATREQLVYDRTFKNPDLKVVDGKCVLFGHTPTSYLTGNDMIIGYRRDGAKKSYIQLSDGRYERSYPITEHYKIHLDTGTWLNGVLGCICIETCHCYYAKKSK